MPQLTWLGDTDARRASRRVPYRILEPVETVGDPKSENLLIQGDNLKDIIDQHFSKQPGADALARMERSRNATLAELVRAAVSRDSKRRPSATRLRAGFAAIRPELAAQRWPLRF